MIIRVTDKDIAEGTRKSCMNCPVARAINKVLPDKRYCTVGRNITIYTDIWWPLVLEKPESVSNFVSKFDAGLPVEPFEFEIEL